MHKNSIRYRIQRLNNNSRHFIFPFFCMHLLFVLKRELFFFWNNESSRGCNLKTQHYDDISRAFQGLYWRSRGFTISNRIRRDKKKRRGEGEWTEIFLVFFRLLNRWQEIFFFSSKSINNPSDVAPQKNLTHKNDDFFVKHQIKARGLSRASFPYL